jgi:aminoglycoside phosphotransferase (APT) family kinase protein
VKAPSPDEGRARVLLEHCGPGHVDLPLRYLGAGWDNEVWRVGEDQVLRIPRREEAEPLLRTEAALLPWLAGRLPLPTPQAVAPLPVADGPEPPPALLLTYLPGRLASQCGLVADARRRLARPLGELVRALHDQPASEAVRLGIPGDTLGRVRPAGRRAKLPALLERLRAGGLLDDPTPHLEAYDRAPRSYTPREDVLVHGDLRAGQLLLDDRHRPCGLLDWGDAHLGDPAVDLTLLLAFLPPSARSPFLEAYGPVSDPVLGMARARAIWVAANELSVALDQGDDGPLAEGRASLAHLLDEETPAP